MLSFKGRTATVRQTKFIAKVIVSLVLVDFLDLIEERPHDARSQEFYVSHPWPEGWYWRIVSGEKRSGCQDTRNPGNTRLLSDKRTCESNRMREQQIRAVHRF